MLIHSVPDTAGPFTLGMWQIGFLLPGGTTLYCYRAGGQQVPENPQREWGIQVCHEGQRRHDLEQSLSSDVSASRVLFRTAFAGGVVLGVKEKDIDALVGIAAKVLSPLVANRQG